MSHLTHLKSNTNLGVACGLVERPAYWTTVHESVTCEKCREIVAKLAQAESVPLAEVLTRADLDMLPSSEDVS